jgi:catechol 2,3-dioxygenase-like lactoylglutathione lyase family enzyme
MLRAQCVHMIERIDHINLVVGDLEKMVAFYRDLLGLKVTKEVTISGDWVDKAAGLTGAEADVVYLDAPSGARIELIRYRRPTGATPALLGKANTRGLRHIAFRVSDIDSLVHDLRYRGVKFFSQIQQVPDEQVTYAGDVRKRLIYFHDPESNILELCEYRSPE